MPDVDYSGLTPPKVSNSSFVFYDIESLQNIFTVVAYHSRNSTIDIFVQLDEDDTDGVTMADVKKAVFDRRQRIAQENPAWLRRAKQAGHPDLPLISVYDLNEENSVKSLDFVTGGAQDSTRLDLHARGKSSITGIPITCDTHPQYDPVKHPFIAGYNSNQYDTTILALYLSERLTSKGFQPVSAAQMRAHNDGLFALVKPSDPQQDKQPMPKYLYDHPRAKAIRLNWINSGRHVDLARLNELQARVALKRLLGMLGHQILESDRLSGTNARVDTLDDVMDLITYNISDAVGTALLTEHPVYSGSFDLRSGLLRTYPEVVFDHKPEDLRTPDQNTTRVLKGWPRPRLTVDSSSAQFAGRILAPYRDLKEIKGHVADLPVVSFRYPDPLGHNGSGEEPVNVLSQARDFFFESVPPTTPAGRRAHEAFEQVYRYYRSIEGLTFTSEEGGKHRPNTINSSLRNTLSRIAEAQPDLTVTLDYTCTAVRIFNGYRALCGAGTHLSKETDYGQVMHLLGYVGPLIEKAELDEDERSDALANTLRMKVMIRAWMDSNDPYWPGQEHPGTEIDTDSPDAWRNKIHRLSDIAKPELNMPYYGSDGSESSGFVTFSYGGIHGAEFNRTLLESDAKASNRGWALFHAAIEAAYQDWWVACARVDADQAQSKREADGVVMGRKWIPEAVANSDPATRLPELDRPNGTPYQAQELAIAAWWLRKRMRIEVDLTDDEGNPVVVEWDHVLKSTSKAGFPVIRDYPKGMRNAGPRIFVSDDKINKEAPTGPPAEDGSDPVNAANKLEARYRYTSVDDVIHEDFTSYYPLMLVNLAAFANPDLTAPGEPARDKYSEIFADKERYGRLMKDPDIDAETKAQYGVLRNGVKLILNAASGAADARHDTPILMNNMIITMRIIGQLFSWRIGQAQTAAGGTIVSTNTDGLYSTLDEETNNHVLAQHTEAIGVEIEPEPLTLVSKDANNRVEFFTPEDSARIEAKSRSKQDPSAPAVTAADVEANPSLRHIVSAGGGTLACWEGPSPTKSLAHSAMIDRLLVEYFKYTSSSRFPTAGIGEPMDREILRSIVEDLTGKLPAREMLRMYQNLLASSPSAPSYIYAASHHIGDATDSTLLTFPGDPRTEVDAESSDVDPMLGRRPGAVVPSLLGHYTRVFSVRPEAIGPELAEHVGHPVLLAAAKAATISDDRLSALQSRGASNPFDQVSSYLLTQAGENVAALRHSRAITLAKHSGVDPTETFVVYNRTLADHPDDRIIEALLEAVDVDAYLDAASESFDKNWRNAAS